MIHSFNKYTIQLERYQLRPISPWIKPFDLKKIPSLKTTIKIFQNELHWNDMWDIKEVKRRLNSGYRFYVLQPKSQIWGWIWISPDHEVKNLYVRPYHRFNPKRTKSNPHWGTQLVYTGLNCCYEQDFDDAFFRIDIWNKPSNCIAENILEQIGCKSSIELVEEEY